MLGSLTTTDGGGAIATGVHKRNSQVHRRDARRLTVRSLAVGLGATLGAVAIGAVLPGIVLSPSRRGVTPAESSTTLPGSRSGGGSRNGSSGGSPTTSTTTSTSTSTSTTTTTVAPDPAGRPSALVQAADSKTICITGAPGQGLQQDDAIVGMSYNCIETFTDNDRTWSQWVSPWLVGSPGDPFKAWVRADPTRRQLIITQNLIPDYQASDPNWVSACASGAYDSYASQFATNLVASGFGYSVIRLGHEMNGDWETDSLGDSPAQWQLWGQCFAQEVTAMRSVAGAHFLFDWSINAGYRNIPLADFYPGDAYVDIVGISFYDQSNYQLPAVGTPGRWQALSGEPMGLDVVEAFAAAHNKPLAFGEWGTVTTQGDDANYVTNMGTFIATHNVAYEAWFNANDLKIYPLLPSMDPLSVAAYIKTVVRGG